MRIATWNVNSIRAREARLLAFLERWEPDVLCVQELKVEDDKFPSLVIRGAGYHAAFTGQRSYNGVAVLSREAPSAVRTGLGDPELDQQARYIEADFDWGTVASAYFPNGSSAESDKYVFKQAWMQTLANRLATANAERYVLCGDYNVAPFDDDMSDPSFRDTVLGNDRVRQLLVDIRRSAKVRDVVRPFYPAGHANTWWDYRARGFERDHGLRIDHIDMTDVLSKHVCGAFIDRDERSGEGASDHAPVLVELDLPST